MTNNEDMVYHGWEEIDYSHDLALSALCLEEETENLLKIISKRILPSKEERDGTQRPFFNTSRSDFKKFLQDVEKQIYLICNEFASMEKIRRLKYGDEIKLIEQTSDTSVVSVINRPDMFGIKTPYIKRQTSPFLISSLPYQTLIMDRVYACEPKAQHLKSVPQIDVYAISVYPSNTSPGSTLDPDNLALKFPIDILTRMFRRDDNGYATHLHIGAVFNDDLDPGTYTLILEKSSKNLSIENVVDRLLSC